MKPLFFNKVKSLFEVAGYSWRDSEEGFLWCEEDRGTGLAWMFYLYADCLKIILGMNGFQRASMSLDEKKLLDLHYASGCTGSSVNDITKEDLSSILAHIWDEVRERLNKNKTEPYPGYTKYTL